MDILLYIVLCLCTALVFSPCRPLPNLCLSLLSVRAADPLCLGISASQAIQRFRLGDVATDYVSLDYVIHHDYDYILAAAYAE